MLRKSSSSSGGGGGGIQRSQGPAARLSNAHTGSLSAGSTKTWDVGRGSKSPHPLVSMGLEPCVVTGAPGVDPDYVMQLVNDVRKFADVLLNLKDAFHSKETQDGIHQLVKERLGELLRVLKAVIGKHQTLNSVDILGAAGTVIAKVKGVNFKEVNDKNKNAVFGDIYASIDTLAFTFGNVVSDFLMGDVDGGPGLGFPQTRRTRSFENLSANPGGYVPEENDLAGPEVALSREEEVDLLLLKNDQGVESALLYAKAWSKYAKDVLAWVEKRLALDVECAKSYAKMAESAKTLASQQVFMPFSDFYISTFKNDMEYSQLLLQTATALQTNKFIQPLLARKTELDKLRKDIKEQWQREQKKTQEADVCVRKARLLQAQRREELQKAPPPSTQSPEELQPNAGNKQQEKRRKLEEKSEEAQEQFRVCVAEAGARRRELANAKAHILTQTRELVFQCDLTLKAVTVNWFQMQQAQTVALPAHYQALCESAKLYEPGQRYAEFVRNLPRDHPRLESLSSDNVRFPFKRSAGSSHSSHGNLSQVSVASYEVLSGDDVDGQPAKMGERRSNSSTDLQAALRGQAPLRAWASGSQGGGMCSDSESAGGSSESRSMDSPTASPGDFKRRLPRTPSTGTMSSADDLDEREPPSPSDNGLGEMVTETPSSPGPFRNVQMSKAAHTHKLRKLRAPSKCRECDGLVVFHGAECQECSLACHKKCLETLAIQCGHKKLQGRLQLFGIDFAQAAKNSADGIPFIIKKCTSEIESRALNIKGIYRVNGAKSRVEKLCQAFENGKDLVELSDLSPHDISNVLKLYLRQLPEPLIMYRYYNDFIGLAKESQRAMVEEIEAARAAQQQQGAEPGKAGAGVGGVQLNRVVFKIRDLLRQLPPAQYRTLRFLLNHLHRVTEQAEENKMTASNLGIIFGPTLVKPRQADAEVSLSSLVDYPYQALMVELLVRHFHTVFDVTPGGGGAASPGYLPTATAAAAGHASPGHTPPEKEQRLSRHSTSLQDIKESAKVYKRHSSVIPSARILDEMTSVQPGTDMRTDMREATALDRLNGLQPPNAAAAADVQRSTLVFGRPSLNLPSSSSSSSSSSTAPRVQLRAQRPQRFVSRPISMPLERLPAPAGERNGRDAVDATVDATERGGSACSPSSPPAAAAAIVSATIPECAEPEKPRGAGAASRVSTYYITPFIDTQAIQRRTWERKYKHYNVTPRTAMIVNNLPPAATGQASGAAAAPASSSSAASLAPGSIGALFPGPAPFIAAVKPFRTAKRDAAATAGGEPGVSANPPMSLRAPRTLQPPPGTFYKPPASAASRLRLQANSQTAVATSSSVAPPSVAGAAPPPRTPDPTDSSSADPEAAASDAVSPPLSPAPGSPEDLSPGEAKPLYQRLRPRHLQELEHREAHFV